MATTPSLEQLISLCKRRGFVFPGSEIYGGLANAWDYGPIGIELKNNIKKLWWKEFIQKIPENVGLDCSILMNPNVWRASGHLDGFTDPLVDCKKCKSRHRADQLYEDFDPKNPIDLNQTSIVCPNCGEQSFTEIRDFNLLFKTSQGVTEESTADIYLRPELAQGMFINFKNVQTATRKKIPFGVGSIGKSFRNEITPGRFIFRTREFEQMELEYFCHEHDAKEKFAFWLSFCEKFLQNITFTSESYRLRMHEKDELSHYSDATTDIEFLFPFGWGELWGIAHRGNFDLRMHIQHSKKDLKYQEDGQEAFIPHVIEPSLGVDRLMLAVLTQGYVQEELDNGESRIVMKIHHSLAPYKVAILPLSKKLSDPAKKLIDLLSDQYALDFDETGSIGKRYRRQDEIGTPICITYDFESASDNQVTIRHRDTMKQERINIDQLTKRLHEFFA